LFIQKLISGSGEDLWSLIIKCNHKFKAGAKFPCRGAAFELSPAFQSQLH